MSSYRQKPGRSTYYVVNGTDASGAFVFSTTTPVNGTVYYASSSMGGTAGAELPNMDQYGATATITAKTPGAANVLLRDLGAEIHVYSDQAVAGDTTGQTTSPYVKLAIFRAMVPLSGALTGGASTATLPTWVKVWSASGTGVGVARA